MVLNPPFGVEADVANRFIEKALTFNPKLLILTVPEETERYDHLFLHGTLFTIGHQVTEDG